MKKGQLTLFIGIGILILIVLGLALYVGRPTETSREGIQAALSASDIQSALQGVVRSCAEDSLVSAAFAVAGQGGKGQLTSEDVTTADAQWARGVDHDRMLLVDRATLETNVEGAALAAFMDCVALDELRTAGINVTGALPIFDVTINEDSIDATITWPARIARGTVAATIDDARVRVPLRLGRLHSSALVLADRLAQDNTALALHAAGELFGELAVVPVNSTTAIISHSEERTQDSPFTTIPLIFSYAAVLQPNRQPTITAPQQRITIKDGTPTTLRFTTSDEDGDTLTLEDDTPMFDVDDMGVASFTPEVPGDYVITVYADDRRGGVGSTTVTVTVTP